MTPSLLFLTDLTNGSEKEDLIISNFLKTDFNVTISHPRDSQSIEKTVDAIIIRNTWNEKEYGKPEPWYGRWRNNPNLPIHDDLYIREGQTKDYLLRLHKDGYPVIPSVDVVEDIDLLPEASSYFVKPKDGFDSINARKVEKEDLATIAPREYLIQPFVDFEYEISFYFLDKKLQYTLYAPDKTKRWNLVSFSPSGYDLAFAEQFIQCNPQRYGIERIDACRLKNGKLWLMEITDQGGVYLSVPDLPENLKNTFLQNLSLSISKNCA